MASGAETRVCEDNQLLPIPTTCFKYGVRTHLVTNLLHGEQAHWTGEKEGEVWVQSYRPAKAPEI